MSREKFYKSMNLPAALRKLRKGRGLTQARLTRLAGVPMGAVSLWELGKAKPDAEQLVALARALEASTDELLGLARFSGDAALAAKVDLKRICGQLREILNCLEHALAEPPDEKPRPRSKRKAKKKSG